MRPSAVRRMEWNGVPRSVGMALVDHKTESMYLLYAESMQAPADLERAIGLIAAEIPEWR